MPCHTVPALPVPLPFLSYVDHGGPWWAYDKDAGGGGRYGISAVLGDMGALGSLPGVFAHLRLLLFAAIGGVLTGLISWAFLEGLDHATSTRLDHGWLLYTLPAVGLAVGAVYFYLGGHAKGGTAYVIEQGNVFTHGVPTRMAPLLWGGSAAGHLAGASVGREGAALQMAGLVTDTAARLGRLSDTDRRTLVVASLAGGWGGVFAVPFTGVVFALQMARKHRWQALAPSIVAGLTATWIVDLAGYEMTGRPHLPTPARTNCRPFQLSRPRNGSRPVTEEPAAPVDSPFARSTSAC